MKEIIINRQTKGTKLLRILVKLLPEADKNFIYKMLRKKNITLNDKKASGGELLEDGDSIKLYFSDETYAKFAGNACFEKQLSEQDGYENADKKAPALDESSIIFEDEDIILCNKPVGVLSQKAERSDFSMVEMITGYLSEKKEYDPSDAAGFKPAVTNRLDRNTSGIIAAGKSVAGLKFLSEGFKKRTFEKLYLCVVKGRPEVDLKLNGLWSKSSHGNKVVIKNVGTDRDGGFPREYFVKGNIPVQTMAVPLKTNGEITLCLVRLMTGKTHQIRAQMTEAGYPLLGDDKYGNKAFNKYYKRLYKIEFQLLHAFMLDIPGKGTFFADIPDNFEKLLKGEDLWVHGIREVFAAQLSRI